MGHSVGVSDASAHVGHGSSVGVVIATRNRVSGLVTSLDRLSALPDRPQLTVVDNGSTDDTRAVVAERFPAVQIIRLPENRGALARNEGVRALSTPYVAFSDDDSWWAPGALTTAAELLDADRRIGLLAARTLVGPQQSPDPLNEVLARSPLAPPAPPALPGPRVLGFLGCAAVARRSAFLAAGGYHPLLFFGAEETLLAYDLAADGWVVCYAPDVVALHHPAEGARPGRAALVWRNETLTAWLRRPLPVALERTARLARKALGGDPVAREALRGVVPRLAAALRERRVPIEVEEDVRQVAGQGDPRGRG